MTANDKQNPTLDVLLDLEKGVWLALMRGDAAADMAALADDFIGVYPSGLSDRAGHAEQLAGGPSVAAFEILDARHRVYGPDLAMLVYRVRYRRAGPGREDEHMWVSSLWQCRGGTWRNRFSQDTPVAG
jgi:hypothetical protein